MSVTEAQWGYGATLTRDVTAIAEVKSIGVLGRTRTMIPATHLLSPDEYEEVVPGLKRAGALVITGNFIPGDTGGQAGLESDFEDGTLQSFTLAYPDDMGTTFEFDAYVSALEVGEVTPEGLIGFSATMTIQGKPALGVTYSTGLTTTFFAMSESAVIVPAPANAVYDYVATVLTGVTSVTVTPIAAAGVIRVNGNIVATGQASSAITLGAAGSVTDVTITVKETNKAKRTYIIHVARAAS
jgi:hypothetical protein